MKILTTQTKALTFLLQRVEGQRDLSHSKKNKIHNKTNKKNTIKKLQMSMVRKIRMQMGRPTMTKMENRFSRMMGRDPKTMVKKMNMDKMMLMELKINETFYIFSKN